ncbi:conjugal transfer protein TrbH [Klebsiella pneumoniae]|uniref:conjugal transfer protein TrbH n=1 Tax=Escherichia coli TaxID=562 RepID=UPI00128167BB|nr:conjugal transfer protein TrbH [Escherichia coli]EBT2773851.1 conjugal transfer protein TrbH [Salmonella enterica]EFA8321621.1 conjugal transfer protein TrbH [Escherichia coli O157]EKZ5999805.1 conjugal transfer protein TrbH [Klebsiella pneumoniae]EMD0827644.1 conjugal transfer protein TrbH [Enterobacter hormaechei subsp. hoffmannii]EDJ5745733.1 conjugal transfer protein TrbH [Salmonella enterica]
MQVSKLSAAFMLATTLVLTGCTSPGYGNFSNASMFASTSMADNTVAHLASLYPAGSTTFAMKQPATDPFGSALVQRLRSRGFAVKEFTKDQKSKSVITSAPGTSLGYVVSTVDPNLFQVTTYVGNTTLSRGFTVATDGKAYPAGPWTREE